MTVLRCTAKLLKRLKQPARPADPSPETNPLGEWYADIDFWRRQPFVVMLNGATGAVLVLPGNAANLRRLHERVLLQFAGICAHVGLHGTAVDAELNGFHAGFSCAATRDRSLLSSLNQRKFEFWMALEHSEQSLPEIAAQHWESGLFKHAAVGHDMRFNSEYHRPLDLLRQRLMPSAKILPFDRTASTGSL